MSPYRNSARPDIVVGDRVRISIPWYVRMIIDSGFSSWNGHTATVRSLFTYEVTVFEGRAAATLDLDVGCGIHMPVRFLTRFLGPHEPTGAF